MKNYITIIVSKSACKVNKTAAGSRESGLVMGINISTLSLPRKIDNQRGEDNSKGDKQMGYSGENYEFLFDKPGQIGERAFEALHHADVMKYRAKTIKSGNIVECEIYPIWNTRGQAAKAKKATTRQAQKNLNEKNAKKNLIRKINTNFTESDLCITLTYKGQVPDEAQARKDIQNYIRRVKAYRKKNGMDDLKYIYVIEFENGEGWKKTRVHHHVIMSGMDRDAAERLWTNGWANTRRLQPDEYGLEALARYIAKDPKGKKRWSASRNLKEPKVTTADTKFTKRMAERLAEDFETDGPQIFAKLFPDCVLNDCAIFRSDFVAGAYVYAKMRIDPQKVKRKREKKRCKEKN